MGVCMSILGLKRRKGQQPRKVYIVNEPPAVIEAGNQRYECRSIVQVPNGLLCIQYDGTAVLIPPAQMQQQQAKAPLQAQLV
jgi:hypothetical protein